VNFTELLASMFQEGGFFMIPILICAVFGAAISLERFFYIFFRASINAPAFMTHIQREILDGNIESAIRLCNGEASASLPKVIKAALLRAGRSNEEVKSSIEEGCLEVQPLLSRRLGYLTMIANVSTLLGLLGTIQGLIIAFHGVAEGTAEQRSVDLANGIAVAMYTTFFGLLVAIPILVAHSLLSARANQVMDDIDHFSLKISNLLSTTSGVHELDEPPRTPVLPFPGR
jgi:biopolymer transport protein ExbB/TolQ